MVRRLDSCCCCFDNLRDGARAVGITMLVLTSLGLISEIAGTAVMAQEHPDLSAGEITQIVFQFLASILQILFNALLVHGVNKSHRGMVLSWIIFTAIINVLSSIGIAVSFIVACISGIWWVVLLVLGVAALVGVFWYWFVVVLHYYQDMREKNGFVHGRQENDAL